MTSTAVPTTPLIRKALAEGTVGERVRACITSSGLSMVAAAEALCVPRSKLYEVLDSQRRAPLTLFECAPELERAWVRMRAEALGMSVASRESSGEHSLMDIVRTFSAVMSASASSEADGHITPEEADIEMKALAEARGLKVAR